MGDIRKPDKPKRKRKPHKILPKNSILPQKGGQTNYFKFFNVKEVLFGGAAGGGKSFSIIVDALGLQYKWTELGKAAIDIPDYRAIIFRRKTTQLQQLITEAKRYYMRPPFNAAYISQRKGLPGISFIFPSGAMIFMAHLENENDVENHQGAEYSAIFFDELTQFTAYQYQYLLTRLRTTIPHFNTRIRATTNPTGAGLLWVKKRFIQYMGRDLNPNKVYYFKHDFEHNFNENPAGIMTQANDPDAMSRAFVPALLKDNKILREADPNYEKNIKAMGKRWTRALLYGDWNAFSGSFFDEFNTDCIIDPFIIPDQWTLFAGLDPGYSSPAAFILFARDFDGNVYVLFTYKVGKTSPDKHASNIRERILGFPYITDNRFPPYCASGVDAWAKRDRHALIANELTFADFFKAGIPEMMLRRANIARVAGWWAIKQLMTVGKFYIFKGFNEDLTEEVLAAEPDDKDAEDIDRDTSSRFHALDALRYGIMSIKTPEKPEEEPEEHPEDVWNQQPEKDARRFW